MSTHADAVAVSPFMMRKLGKENREMGIRLAQVEFHNMLAELQNPQVFELKIDFPDDPAPDLAPPLLSVQPIAGRMPVLNVTLGRTAWVLHPEELPVIGIFIPAATPQEISSALAGLITAHYTETFARFVFLCEELRPIPLLGRYNFAVEHLGKTKPNAAARRLNLRFGVVEIRHLLTSALLWRQTGETDKIQKSGGRQDFP